MSHFGRSGPPDISDTYSLLILNITFRTTPDDLYPLFSKYGKVVDIFIPRDRRTGDSKGFAFVRYKRADEAQKAIERLDGRNVDGREIVVQFAKYGPNAELIRKGRVSQESFKQKLSGSRSPRRLGRRDDYNRERDYRQRGDDNYRGRDYRRVSRSPDRYGRRRDRDRDERRPRSRSASRSYSRSRSRSRSHSPDYSRRRKRSRSMSKSPETKEKGSPHAKRSHRSPSLDSHPSSSPSPRKRPLDRRGNSPVKSASPDDRQKQKRSPSPSRDSRSPPSGNTDNEV